MRKEYTVLLIVVNDAEANVKEAIRPYHRLDRPENRPLVSAKPHSAMGVSEAA